MSIRNILPCIVCKKNLEPSDPRPEEMGLEQSLLPYAGLQFTSYGHYGGTLFDPMDGSRLAVNICDDCLHKAGQDGHVLVDQKPVVRISWKTWKPDVPR